MKIINLFFLVILTSVLFFVSCNGNDDDVQDCSINYSTELQDEYNALVNAATVLGQDPENDSKCQAYKTAVQNYINKLRPYGNCSALTGQNRTQYEALLQEWEDEVATLCVD